MTLTTTIVIVFLALCCAYGLALWRHQRKLRHPSTIEDWARLKRKFEERNEQEMARRTVPWGADAGVDD